MIENTIPLKVPVNVLDHGLVYRRDAVIQVDRISYKINGDVTIIDHRNDKLHRYKEEDKWALEEIVGRMFKDGLSSEDAISGLVAEIIEERDVEEVSWLLSPPWIRQTTSHKGRQIPDWLALGVYNAIIHGNPQMWNPYGKDKPAESIFLSALDFVRTYNDLGEVWLNKKGTIETIVTQDEVKSRLLQKNVSRRTMVYWDNNEKRPRSINHLQSLAKNGIILPLKGTEPMVDSLFALGNHVFFHGEEFDDYYLRFTIPPWQEIPQEGESLASIDYRLWPFYAQPVEGRMVTIGNFVPRQIGRILATTGVPVGEKQKYDGNRYVLKPASEAYRLLISGIRDNILRRFVHDYVEDYLLLRGGLSKKNGQVESFRVSFFGQRFLLPHDFKEGASLDRFIEIESANLGLQDHLNLIEFLFPGITYWIQPSRKVNISSRDPYYSKLFYIHFWDVDRLMDTMPKLQVHYDRPRWN